MQKRMEVVERNMEEYLRGMEIERDQRGKEGDR